MMEPTNQPSHQSLSKIPDIIYGTAWKKNRTTDYVLKAFHCGFRGVDTACQPKHYQEPLVGEALQQLHKHGVERSDYYLQTKFTPLSGQDPNQIPYDANADLPDQIKQSFTASLQHLHTEYLDAYILHSPLQSRELTLSAWHAMETIYTTGKTHRLGISNCYDLNLLQFLYEQADVKPSIVQNRFYLDTDYDIELRRWCNDNHIVYQSFWTLTANPHVLKHELIHSLAQQYEKTPAQILFGYLHQRGVVPLTGTTSEQHMKEDLLSFNLAYTNHQLMQIDALLANA